MTDKIVYYGVENFWNSVAERIEHTDVVLDVGCGIVPMSYFRPSLHIMVEPFKEYVDILLHRHAKDKSIFVVQGSAQEILPHFTDNSVDSVFLLDVIEHLEKDAGFEMLRQAERIARRQIIVFTPLGFMRQHVAHGETDAWGLGGAEYQEHLSGWMPEDFGETWDCYVCENFHQQDFRGEALEKPHGAIFAMKTFTDKPLPEPGKIVAIRRPLPSEILLDQTRAELAQVNGELAKVNGELAQVNGELAKVNGELAKVNGELAKVNAAFAQAQGELARSHETLAQAQVLLSQTQAELSQNRAEVARGRAEMADAQRIANHPAVRFQRKLWRAVKFWG